MSDEIAKGTSEIEMLLADRQRLNDWLDRLAGADDAPAHVRQRVRADYEGRMAEVVSRLGNYREAISASLEEERTRLDDVQSQRAEAEEERAEARLRHLVGEFGEDEWQRMDGELGQRVEGHLAAIGELTAEINRLEEVLAQIAPSPAAPRAPSAVPVDDTAQPVALQPADQAADPTAARGPEAPRFTPRDGEVAARRERSGGRTLRFPSPTPGAAPADEGVGQVDEMTFIKSVALENPVEDPGRLRSAGKTLKCVDCGAMNRPTEWYCERCGAELAAL